MPTLLERIGVELPIVQAGMGGGVASHELAAAVSEAGGLGTIAVRGAEPIARELAAARKLTARPVAVNVLLPFAPAAALRAAAEADVVVTFWGRPRRLGATTWLHQVGSVDEARAAHAASADGVIVQGVEAGGHVRGTTPGLELLAQVRAALPALFPIWLAGGIATSVDVCAALGAGAEAAVAGTRFLMSDESCAHPDYKARLRTADHTILTELFGAGWPAAPHRVVPNAATEHWLGEGTRVPRALRVMHALSAAVARAPLSWQQRAMQVGRPPTSPFLAPAPPIATTPASLVDAGPLYAGETVERIGDIRPAGELVRALTS